MDIQATFQLWCEELAYDSHLSQELATIADNESAISDRFYRNLEFDTGGLRGEIGVGTNRMDHVRQ